MKQWWFDRRNKFEWATFWTAVVVFILTVVFGLIASITGHFAGLCCLQGFGLSNLSSKFLFAR
jgi:hypothetical protein